MDLPQIFLDRMKVILKDEYKEYEKSCMEDRYYGLRVNTLKIDPGTFEKLVPFHLKKIPFLSNGFYYNQEDRPAKHPYYHAGLYYLQEPSAMTPAQFLPIDEGDYVLDLCAAPGGKTTELGAKLKHTGLLVANDLSVSRAKTLLKNIELFGIRNCAVVSENPQKLKQHFPEFFDKILVDAPCSGEGMFRKDPTMIKSWMEHGPQYFVPIQREILEQAADMLKPGGMMLYSTCTFSPEENEGAVQYLLERGDFTVLQVSKPPEFAEGRPDLLENAEKWEAELKRCVRIWPHKIKGEGHFLALLQKKGTNDFHIDLEKHHMTNKIMSTELAQFFQVHLKETKYFEKMGYVQKTFENNCCVMPEQFSQFPKIRILRSGLLVGEMKQKRFQPCQPFAMAIQPSDYNMVIDLPLEDVRIIKYLKGDTIDVENETIGMEKGFPLLCVNGFPLGFGKLADGRLKNKYQVHWRWQ